MKNWLMRWQCIAREGVLIGALISLVMFLFITEWMHAIEMLTIVWACWDFEQYDIAKLKGQ